MIGWLATAIVVASLAVGGWAVVLTVRDRPVGLWLVCALGVVEVLLLVNAVAGFVNLATTSRDVVGWEFGGYLVGALLVLPAGTAWSLAERSRWGSGVVVVACWAIPVMIVRMSQLWSAGG